MSLTRTVLLLALTIVLNVFTSEAQRVVVRKRVPPRGRTVVRVDNSVQVVYRGVALRYSRGVFYRPVVGRGYVVVAPPIGVRVAVLPVSYTRLLVRGGVFFYYNGIFYQTSGTEYVVVTPPIGARVTALPPGSELKLINGSQYYVVDNTYYKEVIEGNAVHYEVVEGPPLEERTMMVGARLPRLPEDAEIKIIDDQKFYVADGVYFKEIIEDNTIWYEVVGEN